MNTPFRQRGFSLVTAIFLLVVLGAIGAYMLSISGVQRQTSVLSLQGVRAYHAARSGIEWASHRILAQGDDCAAIIANGAFTFNAPGLNRFAVTLTCSSSSHTEGPDTYNIYQLGATATYGNFGDADYARRIITTSITPHVNP
jgi:MSHA biogenesis protein MshP